MNFTTYDTELEVGNPGNRYLKLEELVLSSPLPLQFTYWVGGLMVEHLKVMAASRACLRILSLWSSASGPYQSST